MTEIPPELVDHVIVTKADGELVTDPEHVDAIARKMVDHGKGVLHFHRGLSVVRAPKLTAMALAEYAAERMG